MKVVKKYCSDCDVELIDSNYVVRTHRGKCYVTKRCKKCHCVWKKSRRSEEEKAREKEKNRLRAVLVYAKRREIYLSTKRDVCCVDCGIKDYRVIDWHHIDPNTKLFFVSDYLMRTKISIDDVYNEIKKCIPLCANCHRIRHYRER
jgi:hypothetical protein